MPRGRRPGPGTAEEKAAARREKVRLNVQAYRKRKHAAEKDKQPAKDTSLKWVKNTKWQLEYEQHSRSDHSSDTDQSMPDGFVADSKADEICTELVVQTPQMYNTPEIGKQNSLQILAMFPERFLPDQLSLPSMFDVTTIRTPCALWVMTAVRQALRKESGALNDVVHSIVLSMMGMEQGRPEFAVEAQRLYTRSLNKTRRSLGPILSNNFRANKNDILDVFLSCHAAAIYELMVNGSTVDMRRHVHGIGLLIEHERKMPDFPTVAGNSLTEEYRMFEIQYCLLDRTPTTNFRLKRATPDSTKMSHSEAIVNAEVGLIPTLLDLADQIPPIMVELDSFKDGVTPTAGQLMKLVQQALSLHSQLDSWSTFLYRQAFPNSPQSDASTDNAEHLDLGQITQYEYVSCYLFSLSYDLHALEVCIEAVSALALRTTNSINGGPAVVKPSAQQQLLRTKCLGVAGTILELMPYFLQNDKGIIGRSIAMWPLEAVWKVLDSESDRLRWDEHVTSVLNVSTDFKNKIKVNRLLLEKYYRTCQQSARRARGYGLPLIKEREIDDAPGIHLQPKSRVESIPSEDESLNGG